MHLNDPKHTLVIVFIAQYVAFNNMKLYIKICVHTYTHSYSFYYNYYYSLNPSCTALFMARSCNTLEFIGHLQRGSKRPVEGAHLPALPHHQPHPGFSHAASKGPSARHTLLELRSHPSQSGLWHAAPVTARLHSAHRSTIVGRAQQAGQAAAQGAALVKWYNVWRLLNGI